MLLGMSLVLRGDGQGALGVSWVKCVHLGWAGTSVQGDSYGVLPILVTWCATFNLKITLGFGALRGIKFKAKSKMLLHKP